MAMAIISGVPSLRDKRPATVESAVIVVAVVFVDGTDINFDVDDPLPKMFTPSTYFSCAGTSCGRMADGDAIGIVKSRVWCLVLFYLVRSAFTLVVKRLGDG